MKIIVCILILLLLTSSAFAADKKSRTSKAISYVDSTHRYISDYWVGTNYQLDMFFSDQKYKRSENRSKITAYYDVYKQEGVPLQKYFDISIKMHFPKVSKRLSIVIEKERDEILASRTNPAAKGQAAEQANYQVGVGYYLKKIPFVETSFSTGLRIDLPLNPYGKIQILKKIKSSLVNVLIAQRFILYRQEGFSEITQLSFSKRLSDRFSLSQDNGLTWTDEDDLFVLRNSLSLRQTIDYKRNLTYRAGANAFLAPTLYYYQYDTSVAYRQLLHRNWLYGNLSIGAFFPKKKNFAMTNFLLGRVEVLFF